MGSTWYIVAALHTDGQTTDIENRPGLYVGGAAGGLYTYTYPQTTPNRYGTLFLCFFATQPKHIHEGGPVRW